jgi:hypothetical protein
MQRNFFLSLEKYVNRSFAACLVPHLLFIFAPPPCLALISPEPPIFIMEIELLPTVSLLPETNSLLIAPVELLAGALNSHLELQRYKILFISGRSSNRLNRNITELEVRRANTLFQLMTIPTGEPPQLPDRGA